MTNLTDTVDVYHFGGPTIGYCRDCCCATHWSTDDGLFCPVCKTTEVAVFNWDEVSPYPD